MERLQALVTQTAAKADNTVWAAEPRQPPHKEQSQPWPGLAWPIRWTLAQTMARRVIAVRTHGMERPYSTTNVSESRCNNIVQEQ
jgi:hypothetical protein